jgi:TolB-like protein/tetratricopeptide (TPR) repeat protein
MPADRESTFSKSPDWSLDNDAQSTSAAPVADAPRLSIVVLPFDDLGEHPEREYFVDGITESLTTDLSRIPDAFVIARNTAFTYKGKAVDVKQLGRELGVRYALEGSVLYAGERLRVNVRLVDAESGAQVWSERFDMRPGELFEAQDEIVAHLARAMDAQLTEAEARRAERSQSADPNALDLVFRGWAAFNRGNDPASLLLAERFFDQALALAPGNVKALVGMAVSKLAFAANYTTDDRATYLTAAEAAAMMALALAPNEARAHGALAWVYMATNRPEPGIAEAERSIALDRNLAPSYAAIGWAKPMLGRAEETEGHIAQAFRLSPRDTFAYIWCHIAGVAKLSLGRDDEAVAWLRRAVEANRMYPLAQFTLAAALAQQGKTAEARAAAAAGLALVPSFSVRRYREGAPSDNPTYLAYRQHIYVGLLKAGVPADVDESVPVDTPVPMVTASTRRPQDGCSCSYPNFAAVLKGALRDYSRVDLLAGNPLLRSRLMAARGQGSAADLQALLAETVDTLFASPRDEKLRRVIELTYFRPAPKQEAAADRLGLSFGTYRRHLTTALGRLGRWLWEQEKRTLA